MERRTVLRRAGLAAAALVPRGAPRAAVPGLVELDDASRLSRTRVFSHWTARPDEEAGLIARLRAELREAAAAGRPVAVGGARHSMGGQSIPAGGHAVTFDPARCEPDAARRTCRVHGGTRWRRAIAALDPVGLSPAVMQSNADFSVGGTLSVNAHGWPAPFGPFGETVRSFRLMLADGTILDCSPAAHPDLFRAAIGGYGLLGVVLDAELDVVENALLAPTGEILPASAFAARLLRHVDGDPLLRMAYGRLSPARSAFLEEALLVTWRPAPTPAGGLPPAGSGGLVAGVSREVFRAQAGSEFWKGVRWDLERRLGGGGGGGAATRNTLMNEPVSGLAGRDRGRTDILHEYFVPPDRFAEFLAACREVIPPSGQDLLNVTLRHVEADRRSLLAYAPGGRRVAAVMLFAQPATAEADAAMRRMTEALVERVLAIGGTYYLPYRPHARRDQMRRAYPGLDAFLDVKRRHDPGLVFRDGFWDRYLADA